MEKCPKCGYPKNDSGVSKNECPKCGIIYKKYIRKTEVEADKKALESPVLNKPLLSKKPAIKYIIIGIALLFPVFIYIGSHFTSNRGNSRGLYENASPGNRALKRIDKSIFDSEKRTALVIGNSSYKFSFLKNPANDARLMAETLEKLGFDVTKGENLSQKEMKKKVVRFGQQIRKGGVGLFYYAGHGVQVDGKNFLIPINAQIESQEDIEYESVDVGMILSKMFIAENRVNIVILDACRNNPFASSFRSSTGGLAFIDAPIGTIIAYATSPGASAADGQEENGLYTAELNKRMLIPGLKIEELFKKVRTAVRVKTDGKQIPWESTSLEGDFYFQINSSVKYVPDTLDEEPLVYKPEKKSRPPITPLISKHESAPSAHFNSTDEDKAFALYQEAQRQKQSGEFRLAEDNLKKALSYLSEKNSYYPDIKDELYYHLPVAEAGHQIENRKVNEGENTIIPVERYIQNHPKRFELVKGIDRLRTMSTYMKKAIQAENISIKRQLEMAIENEYGMVGEYPKNKKSFVEAITPYLPAGISVQEYSLRGNSYHAVFLNKRTGHLLEMP